MENWPEGTAKSLGEQVFHQLQEEILSGQRKQGESLVEMKLCQQLGVSRTPVREAILLLEQHGLADILPNRSARVRAISLQDMEDIYTIRQYIEGLACRWACLRMTDEELSQLREDVEMQEFYQNKKAVDKMNAQDAAFHHRIFVSGRSRQLQTILTELHHNLHRFRRRSFSSPERAEQAVAEHYSILEAMEQRDADLAEQRMAFHIKQAHDFILTHYVEGDAEGSTE